MKKLLLLIGFLPLFCHAQVTTPLSPTRVELADFLTKTFKKDYLKDFTGDAYERSMNFYQTMYDKSDKSPLCTQTINKYKANLEFQRNDGFEKLIAIPSVTALSDKQAERILQDTKQEVNRTISKDTALLINSVAEKMAVISVDGMVYEVSDIANNCPAKSQ